MIGIIDYGMGNLRSVQKAFERLNIPSKVLNSPDDSIQVDKLILPGVGHFGLGMKNLNEKGWIPVIIEEVSVKKKPILGICLGMQLLTNFSEEGNSQGLGLIDAATLKFHSLPSNFKIPHMGWNEIHKSKESKLLENTAEDDMVYFVHSYFVRCNDANDVLCQTEYGINFHSAFQHENITGFQFHPEKSHKTGLSLLKNFNAL